MSTQDELDLENVFADETDDDASSEDTAEIKPVWLAPNFDGILPELKAVPHWVLAKAVVRDGKITKPPYQPNGQPASHSNPATWSAFAAVKQAYERGGYIGVGFVLDGKPHFGGRYLHGFDWDHCIENGHVDPVVQAELKKWPIPRIETSISGTGIRGFFLHDDLSGVAEDAKSAAEASNSIRPSAT